MPIAVRNAQDASQGANERHRPGNLLANIKSMFHQSIRPRTTSKAPTHKPDHAAVRTPELVTLIIENLTTEELYPMMAVSHTFRDAILSVKKNRKKLFLDFEVRPVPVSTNRCVEANGHRQHNYNPLILTRSAVDPSRLLFVRNPLEDFHTLPAEALCREMYLTQQPVWHASLRLHLFSTVRTIWGGSRQDTEVEIRITRFRSQGIKYGHIIDLVADMAYKIQVRNGWPDVQIDMEKTFLIPGAGRKWRLGDDGDEANRIASGELVVSNDLVVDFVGSEEIRG